MSDDHKQTARDIIERMKTIRPTCDKCESRCYSRGVLDKPLADGLLATGWEPDPNHAGWMRRCETCAIVEKFPWADKLDVERVAHMLEHDWRCQRAFPLAILKETLNEEPLQFRTFMITGVCKLDHEHGKGDCVYDRGEPERKGFEFL